jgi:hypothetical protein
MRTLQKIISAGFATCAFAAASMPALSWTTLGVVENDAFVAAADAPSQPAVMQLALLDTDRR